MGKLILVLGEPGSGKSSAIENLDPSSTVVISPNNKDLPFRGANKRYSEELGNLVKNKEFNELGKILTQINSGKKIKTVIVEDFTHLLNARVMKDAKVVGFQKWTELAKDVFDNLLGIEDSLRNDLFIFLIGHTDRSSDAMGNSIITLQTAGKLLEGSIRIPSYFTYVLHTDVREVNNEIQYSFMTNTDGTRLAKSPKGCFDKYIPNDYKLVINKISEYQSSEVEVINK